MECPVPADSSAVCRRPKLFGVRIEVDRPLLRTRTGAPMNIKSIYKQLRANIVAITSVIVALTGMAYNTYRNEKTEINHNVRAAAFETLKNLGETQILVNYAHFQKDRVRGDSRLGWGRITLIHDVAQVL